MQLTLLQVLPLSALLLTASAYPITPQDTPATLKRAAYSVVAVDGGAAATSSPNAAPPSPATTIIQTLDETVTITAPGVTLSPLIKTAVATLIITDSEPAKTIESVVTEFVTKTTSLPSKLKYVVVNDDTPPGQVTTTSTATASTIVDRTPKSSSIPRTTSAISSSIPTVPNSATSSPLSTSTLPQTSMPPIETLLPDQKGWSLPAGLAPPSSSSSTAPTLSTHKTATATTTATSISISISTPTSNTYDDGMWHTNQPAGTKTYDNEIWHTTYSTWHAASTTLSTSSATASTTTAAYIAWNKG